MTKYPDDFAALCAPFRADMIKSRKHDGARYVKAQSYMTRLDEVVGPENWRARYRPWSKDSVQCFLTLTMPDGVRITKSDVGSYSSMSEKNANVDAGDDEKGGFSDALKRAASQFGVGRHLYDPSAIVPRYQTTPDYRHPDSAAPLDAAEPAPRSLGARPSQAQPASKPQIDVGIGNGNGNGNAAGTLAGRALWAWVRDATRGDDGQVIRRLAQWGRERGFGDKMVHWPPEACREARQLAEDLLAERDRPRVGASVDQPSQPTRRALAGTR